MGWSWGEEGGDEAEAGDDGAEEEGGGAEEGDDEAVLGARGWVAVGDQKPLWESEVDEEVDGEECWGQ